MNAPLVAVTGGKGGVGKTLMAANLGVSLARSGVRTLLVDADFSLANLALVLGLEPARPAEDFFAGEADLGACVVEGPAGVRVLPAASGAAELARLGSERRGRFLEALAALSADYDCVVLDCAAGIGSDVLALCEAADHVLVVTTPDPAAVTDAYGVVKALDARGARTGTEIPTPEIVVNQTDDLREAEGVARKLRAVCERFLARSPVLAGWLPESDGVRRAVREGRPFVLTAARSLPGRCLENLARRVARRARALTEAFAS